MTIKPQTDQAQTSRTPTGQSAYRVAIAFVVLLFFLWGMANNLNDILIAQFKKAFALSDFGTSFVQQVFYFGYFLFSLPAALLMQGRGYKSAIMTGLGCYGVGALLFYPAAEFGKYEFFLVALFIIAGGLAFLETAANPLMTEIGDPAGAARRLNWAQVANPIGTLFGILVGKYFILSGKTLDPTDTNLTESAKALFYRQEILSVRGPYIALGLVVLGLAILAAFIRFPQGQHHTEDGPEMGHLWGLFRRARLRFAVIAQFFYVGAQIGVWSYTIRYAEENAHMNEAAGANALLISLVLFALGRLCPAGAGRVVLPGCGKLFPLNPVSDDLCAWGRGPGPGAPSGGIAHYHGHYRRCVPDRAYGACLRSSRHTPRHACAVPVLRRCAVLQPVHQESRGQIVSRPHPLT